MAIVGLMANPARAAADAASLAVDIHEAIQGACDDAPVELQASIGIVRGIATGASSMNFRSIVLKQMGVGVLLGAMFAVMLGLIAFFLYPDEKRISIVVALAITISMSLASFMGTFLPFLFYKLDKDPAIASGPFVTTTMDILGVTAYLGIAGLLLF